MAQPDPPPSGAQRKPIRDVDRLIQTLRDLPIITPEKMGVVIAELAFGCPSADQLLLELVKRKWLTEFQAKRLRRGEGGSLLVDGYVLLGLVGQGGMGRVYRAWHPLMDREVALKVLHADWLKMPGAMTRFRHEIQAAAKVRHPNVVLSYDARHVGDTFYLVMEYVKGSNLDVLIHKHGPAPIGSACEYARQTALGLQHIHECNLVHRDIKPSNLLLRDDGRVKVLDLGLASLRAVVEQDTLATRLTGDRSLLGTPDYLAPEQARAARSADIRADIYSLGCSLYHLLIGKVPFPGGTLTEKLLAHQSSEPEPIQRKRPDVPAELATIVATMMAKRPEHRYQTPAEVAAILAPFAQALAPTIGSVDEPLPELIIVQPTAPAGTPAPAPPSTTPQPEAGTPPPAAESTEPGVTDFAFSYDAPALTPPPAPEEKARNPRTKQWFLAAGGVCIVLAGAIALIIGIGGKPAVTKPEEVVRPPQPKPAPPVPVPVDPTKLPPEAWNMEVRNLVGKLLNGGTDTQQARAAYGQIADSVDLGLDSTWSLNSRSSADGKSWEVRVEDSRPTSETILGDSASKVDPRPGLRPARYRVPAIHAARIARIERPEIVLRPGDTPPVLRGKVWCEVAEKQRLTDLSACVIRRFEKAGTFVVRATSQPLKGEELSTGPLDIEIEVPMAEPEEVAEDRIELLLTAFIEAPRAGLYQVSNALRLAINDGKVVADPKWKDGWNVELRDLLDKVLVEKADSTEGRRVYSTLAQGLELPSSVSWDIGSDYTRTKRSYVLSVRNRKISSEDMSLQDGLKRDIFADSLSLDTRVSFVLPLQPITVLRQAEARVENTVSGRRLIGRVNAAVLHNPPLDDLRLKIAFKKWIGGATVRSEDFKSLPTPMGWLEFNVMLPSTATTVPSGTISLEAYLAWPRPSVYRISNSVPFTVTKPPVKK